MKRWLIFLTTVLALSSASVFGASTSKVEVLTPNGSDLIFLTVNGIRHRLNVNSAWQDVTSWFVKGSNKTSVQAIDFNGRADFDFQLRVDGKTPTVLNCSKVTCVSNPGGIIYDKTLSMSSLTLSAAQTVKITSSVPGVVYLDDEYTGKTTPASFSLPVGSYKIGLGVSKSTDSDATATYTGTFYEQSVAVTTKSVTLAFDTSKLSPVTNGAVTKVAILPVARASSPELDALNRPGVLTAAMVTQFVSQVNATRTKWLKPLSYGLADWNITVLPMDTQTPLYSQDTSSIVDMAGSYVSTSKYAYLRSTYDVVLVLHSSNDASGVEISQMNPRWGTAGDGRVMSFSSSSWPGYASGSPIDAILHEFLHTYEAPNHLARNYVGVDGLHGGEEHSFTNIPGTANGPYDWLYWYRSFIRGQAGEDSKSRSGVGYPYSSPLLNAPFYVGVFRGMRYHLAPQP